MLVEHSEPIMLGRRIDWSASRSRWFNRRANVRYLQVHQQPKAKLAGRMRRQAARLPKASPKNEQTVPPRFPSFFWIVRD